MSFTVELISNTIYTGNSVNTCAHFKTQLAQKIVLDKDYEVALMYLSYPKSWYTIKNEKVQLVRADQSSPMIPIDDGLYLTAEDLVNEMNNKLYTYIKEAAGEFTPLLMFNRHTFKSHQLMHKDFDWEKHLVVKVSPRLRRLIGFQDNDEEASKVVADIQQDHRTIFAYTNIVDFSFSGHTRSQILHTANVPASATFGEQISLSLNPPLYRPVITNEIHEIEFMLRTQSGAPVAFEFGTVIALLHFRPAKYGKLL